MPIGFETLKDQIDREAVERESFTPRDYSFFKLSPGESAVVRFVSHDASDLQNVEVAWAWCHNYRKPGRQYGDYYVSYDQSGRDGENCPLAQAGIPRSKRGWINLIWRNGPVWEKDANGRVVKDANKKKNQVGTADQLALWSAFNFDVLETLLYLNQKIKGGLGSRDFEISRNTATEPKQVKYHIAPADLDGGPQPLTAEDKALAASPPDLVECVTPKEWDKLAVMVGQPQKNFGGDASTFGNAHKIDPDNPFVDAR